MQRFSGHKIDLWRGYRRLLADFSFSAEAGEILWLKGGNGAGKSSLLRAMAGLLHSYKGEMFLDGVLADAETRKSKLWYMGHEDALWPNLSVADNLRLPQSFEGRVRNALESFGLMPIADVKAKHLSAGQKRRLGLARGLIFAARPIWLLDEPWVNLDAKARGFVNDMLKTRQETGFITVVATHEEITGVNLMPLNVGAA